MTIAAYRPSLSLALLATLAVVPGQALAQAGQTGQTAQTGQTGQSAAPGDQAAVRQAIEQGGEAMHRGDAAAAERSFREATRLAPAMPEAHLDLGLVLAREGRTDDAVAELRRAAAIDPKLPSAHMFLGIFLFQTGHATEARHELEAELALAPDNVEALTWLGIADLAAGDADRAANALDRAAVLQPNDLNILEYRGRAHQQVAQESYARMARLAPENWHVHRVRGELLSNEGKHADAIAEYQAAVKAEPRNPDLWEALGDEYRQTNNLVEAGNSYRKELDLSPGNLIAMYDLGSTEVERGNPAEGVPLLEAMLKGYNGAPVAEYYLGRGLAAEGKNEAAAGWLKKSAAGDPAGEIGKRSWFELTRLFRRMGQPKEATEALAQYNRLREAADRQSAQQVQDWRKLGAAEATPPAAAAPPPATP